MARNISKNVLGSVGLLGAEPTGLGEEPKAKAEEEALKRQREEDLRALEELTEEIYGLQESVKREKAAKDDLKAIMTRNSFKEYTSKSGATAKISERAKDGLNEDAVIAWAKANGHPELFKTITLEQVDMEALERAVYGEEGLSAKPITEVVSSNTTTTTTLALTVSAPKAEKPKKARKGE